MSWQLGVEAVLLDAGGVLLMPDPAAFRARLAPFGVVPDDERCHRAHYLGMGELDRLGAADYPEADRAMADFFGVAGAHVEAAAEAIQWVYVAAPYVPIDGVAVQLRRLHAAGLQLAIVSNASGTVEAQLAGHRICGVGGGDCVQVATVIDSHVVGVEKPDPAIFTFALDALDLAASQCVYVGDSVHFDVNGARAAGIRPVHLSP